MAALTPEQKECGVALLDLGAGTTSYLVYAGGTIALAGVLAVGGDHITNDVSIGFSVSLKRAEMLKQEAGSVIPDSSMHFQRIAIPAEVGFPACSVAASDLSAVIQARMDETLELLADLFKKQGLKQQLSAGLVLTGGFKPHVGILSLLTMTGIPVLLCEEDTFSVASRLMEMRSEIYLAERRKRREGAG
jgi:cell division protein FtsA